MRFILASNSPRRAELLEMIGLEFEIDVCEIDEFVDNSLSPEVNVMSLAFEKCIEVSKKNEECTVIAADTIVVKDGEILGKPADKEDAIRMINSLNDSSHFVYTGFAIINIDKGIKIVDYEKTEVFFRNNKPELIRNYVDTLEPLDKAGAYGIQGKGSLLVEKINGDYFNVMGLPISKLNYNLQKSFKMSIL